MKTHSLTWHGENNVTLDLRRMRSLLDGLTPEAQEVLVKNLRTAYPELIINILPKGDLQIEVLP